MRGAITPLPNTSSCSDAQLKEKHRDNFTLPSHIRHIDLIDCKNLKNTNVMATSN